MGRMGELPEEEAATISILDSWTREEPEVLRAETAKISKKKMAAVETR